MNRNVLRQAALLFLLIPAAAQSQRSQDSTGFSRKTEVHAAFISMPVKRAVSGAQGPVNTSSATLIGGEFEVRDPNGAGLQLRYMRGDLDGPVSSLSSGVLEYIDGRLLAGTRTFAVVLGYTLRSSMFEGEERRFAVPRAGVQAGYYFAGSGVALKVNGTYVRSIKQSENDSLATDGLEGETSILYVPPRFPVYFELGYRRELWNLKRDKVVARREELGGVMLMVGIQTGLLMR